MKKVIKVRSKNYLTIPDERLQFDASPHGTHSIVTSLIPPYTTVLDIGCSSGYIAQQLKSKQAICDGVDIDKKALKKAGKYCRHVYQRDLYEGKITIPNNKYDYILCADILEHLPRPDLILSDLKKYLKKDGVLIISLPNISRIEHRLSHMLGNFDYSYGIISHDHLRFYTKKSAQNMIESCGYTINGIMPTGCADRVPFRHLDTLLAFQFIFICQKKTVS